MKFKTTKLSDEQRDFLVMVQGLKITRWTQRLDRIIREDCYGEVDRIMLANIRDEYKKYKRETPQL